MKTSFWTLTKDTTIEIPIIQRDYAQGRKDENDIAVRFVEQLKNALDNSLPLNLDFVYGRQLNGKMTPLDGQQRLTTLFLLHWYLAVKENKLTADSKKHLLKFSYETRISSSDFCRDLVTHSISNYSPEVSIRQQIINENWFFYSWLKDPTISSALNMLDVIHQAFRGEDQVYFEKLTSDQITFNYLSLDDYKLSDELYIKMNARGKPLTDFENFKSLFSPLLSQANQLKLDNEWYDSFWNYEQQHINPNIENVDNSFFHFFENITLCFFLENNDLSTELYHSFDLFKYYSSVYENSNEDYVAAVIKCLDALSNYQDVQGFFRSSNVKFNDRSNSYWILARFYALMTYFIHCKPSENSEAELSRWIRVCKNLINNTLIQSVDEFTRAVRAIKVLSKGVDDIYTYLLSVDRLSGLLGNQQQEEKVKAKLILDDQISWEEEINTIESNTYFDGQIGFILELSKTNEEKYDLDIFKTYSIKLDFLFGKLRDNEQYLFQRAFFAINNYLVPINRSYTFCTFQDDDLRSKMDNWRKAFSNHLLGLKQFLDAFELVSYATDLNALIQQCNYTDWKIYFVQHPCLLEHAINYQIRIDNNIISLARSNAKGWSRRAEMYSYLLFKNYLTDVDLKPFETLGYFETGDYKPFLLLENWKPNDSNNIKLEVEYLGDQFEIRLYDIYGISLPKGIDALLIDYNVEQLDKKIAIKTEISDIVLMKNYLIDFLKDLTKLSIEK